MVVIRLARFGAIHKPKYRVTVADSRRSSTGRCIEVVGHYNPFPRGKDVPLSMDIDKIKSWISKGAQPSKRVQSLMKKYGSAQ